jgi:hypothetical protein
MAQNNGGGVGWEPLTVGRATVVDLTTLRWTLSVAPDTDWVVAFRDAPVTRSGVGGFVFSGWDPQITGQEIEWRVDEPNHVSADREVRERVDAANAAYPTVLANRAADRDREAGEKQAGEAAIKEAQRRLDEASGAG